MKPVELAKKTIELYIREKQIAESPKLIEGIKLKQAGVFVSIKTSNDELRGCIGTFLPTKETIGEEIVQNAISAAVDDPRFYPITEQELDNLKISVDVLYPPEKVDSTKELDAKIYGVIVSSKQGKRALLLPNLEGVNTPDEQIRICRLKGNISKNEAISIQRFKVDRYFK